MAGQNIFQTMVGVKTPVTEKIGSSLANVERILAKKKLEPDDRQTAEKSLHEAKTLAGQLPCKVITSIFQPGHVRVETLGDYVAGRIAQLEKNLNGRTDDS